MDYLTNTQEFKIIHLIEIIKNCCDTKLKPTKITTKLHENDYKKKKKKKDNLKLMHKQHTVNQ